MTNKSNLFWWADILCQSSIRQYQNILDKRKEMLEQLSVLSQQQESSLLMAVELRNMLASNTDLIKNADSIELSDNEVTVVLQYLIKTVEEELMKSINLKEQKKEQHIPITSKPHNPWG